MYKKLARKYHPDVSEKADATAKFQGVSEAYEVLKNKEKRAEYDELREYVNNPSQFQNAGAGQGRLNSDSSAENGLDDLLRSIFGDQGGFSGGAQWFNGQHGGTFNLRGQGIRYDLGIILEEAYAGGKRFLRLTTPGGDKTINVTIPKGVTLGKQLRLKGQGELSHGEGPAGDIYLKISFLKYPLFEVDENDITLVLPVSPWDAALGESVEVQTLGGKVNLKIPADSQNGKRLRSKGRGLGNGYQFVMLKLVNPPIETDADKAAFVVLKDKFNFKPWDGTARHGKYE